MNYLVCLYKALFFSIIVLIMYVHLLSNASSDVFPNNKLGDFSTILYNPLTFREDDWEVGIVEMNIPFSFDMLTSDCWVEWTTSLTERTLIKSVDTNYSNFLEEHDCTMEWDDDHFKVTVPDGFLLSIQNKQCGLPTEILGDSGRTFYGDVTDKSRIDGTMSIYKTEKTSTRHTFKNGFFDKAEKLLKTISESLGQISVTEDSTTDFLKCEINELGIVHFSEKLANMLGFRAQSIQSFQLWRDIYQTHFQE